jgi:hypothetical protein
MAGHVMSQPPSQKQWKHTDKSERVYGTSKTRLAKEAKEPAKKPKTASAGGGMKPPSKPPKGPTGGDNKRPKDEGRRPDYEGKKTSGGLTKISRKEETKNPPKPKDRQFDSSYFKKSDKKK